MERVQVQLGDDQLAVLKRRSAASGRPVAALVREAVAAWITSGDRGDRLERALATVGQFHSGLGDLAENHDAYLDEADRS